MTRTFHTDGWPAPDGYIFVFGSNLSGVHGAGAAKAAHRDYGAKWGMPEGHYGHSYAIPTVKQNIAGPLSLEDIRGAVERFKGYAMYHTGLAFYVTRVGCGLAGHKDQDIAPMFADAPDNCSLPEPWRKFL